MFNKPTSALIWSIKVYLHAEIESPCNAIPLGIALQGDSNINTPKFLLQNFIADLETFFAYLNTLRV